MTQLPRHTRLARPLNCADPRLLVHFSSVASVITIYGKITSCCRFLRKLLEIKRSQQMWHEETTSSTIQN
jgi:hypothetical protein